MHRYFISVFGIIIALYLYKKQAYISKYIFSGGSGHDIQVDDFKRKEMEYDKKTTKD